MGKQILDTEIIKSYKEFITSFENFVKFPGKYDNFNDLIGAGLKIYIKFPGAISVSLFLLNDETYEFDMKTALPVSDKFLHSKLFALLIDNGTIGDTLESGKIECNKVSYNDEEKNVILISLSSTNSVLGLVLIILDSEITLPEKNENQCRLFSMIFASTLDNSMLQNSLKRTQSLLEQRVAMRTIGLAQSRRELQAILDSVQAAILVVDRETNCIINANPISAHLLEDTQEIIVGRDINFYFSDNDNQEVINTKVLFSRNFESRVRKANGKMLPILRTTSNIRLGEQNLRIESFFDITERKKFEEALQEANELLELKVAERTEDLQILVHQLKKEISDKVKAEMEARKLLAREQELNELKTRFLSMISHEFRTPLTIISTSTQILDNYMSRLSEIERKEYLKRILKTVDTMKDLLENVLFIGKTDSNILSFDPRPLVLDDFCKTLLEDFRLSLIKKREIRTQIEVNANAKILDAKLLRHILTNVLSNAIKYSPDDKPVDFITIEENGNVVFTVIDYGIGIPDDEQEKIFEVFHRAKNVGSRSGTGLGMSIVVKALELHDGKIELLSKVDQGTTVRIIVPFVEISNNEDYFSK